MNIQKSGGIKECINVHEASSYPCKHLGVDPARV